MAQKKSNSKQSKNSNGKRNEKSQNAYFLSLELENIRCFSEKQKIDFSDGSNNPKRWCIILGDNGTGKTTILQALLTQKLIHIAAFVNVDYSRHHSLIEKAKNELSVQKNSEVKSLVQDYSQHIEELKEAAFFGLKLLANVKKSTMAYSLFSKFINEESSEKSRFPYIVSSITTKMGLLKTEKREMFSSETTEHLPEFNKLNIFAYGASRKAGETSLSEQNKESAYKTLFDETALLINPEEWLLQADYFVSRSAAKKSKEKFRQVKEVLISVLPDVDNIKISERNNKEKSFPIPTVEFHTPYGWVESKDLSLGYRTSMAWIVDFASRMFDLYPESKNPLAEPAVVLIDEIDLHLHPKWQRDLLDYLSSLFPNTQFIVTTHSPLIVQSAVARDANIVVCRREGDHVIIDQSVEAVRNWRADQILTSDFFGLETARPKEIEPLLEEREKILSKAKLTKKDEKRLSELENEIGFMPVSENPEDDKAMDIIRRAAERLESQNK